MTAQTSTAPYSRNDLLDMLTIVDSMKGAASYVSCVDTTKIFQIMVDPVMVAQLAYLVMLNLSYQSCPKAKPEIKADLCGYSVRILLPSNVITH